MYYPLRFLLTVIGSLAILWGISQLMIQFAPSMAQTLLTGPGAVGMFVALMIFPPIALAQSFYRREARPMRGPEGLLLALVCAILFTVTVLGVVYYSLSLYPGSLEQVQRDIGGEWAVAAIPMVFFALVLAGVYRLFFWATIRGQMKRAARAAPRE